MTDDSQTPPLEEQIPEIFADAIEMESFEERSAYLDTACAGNVALREAVERLLARHDDAESFFQECSPTQITAAEITNTLTNIPEFFESLKSAFPDDDEVGKQIGNYKLLQKIGEGGVGNVYLAEQLRPVRRQVAFKVIKAGMDTRSVIARFEAERQALAMMEHPNIAHVLNAGETEAGRPYFVMELVNGERITTYCDSMKLTLHQRLGLFIQVCLAIQHAHQKGVIHRDIKPSNVLITTHDNEPSPVVIDFGIAKATAENLLTDKTINTSVGPIIGTPAYMSPEQTNLSQGNVDTRSDIYSLGVLLYELLISKTPFEQDELLKSGLDEMSRILREKDPLSPSAKFHHMAPEEQKKTAENRGLEPRRLLAMLSDELGWIVMKALDKNRERRYESAGELAADLKRFLNNEAVLACPPSRVYRFRKLVRRNKAVSISAGVITLTLVVSLAVTSSMYLRERESRIREHEARKRAVLAEQLQQQLRMEAEDRERIAQAAFLISQGKLEEADWLVEKVAVVTPSLETESVMRGLGEWHALKGQWSASAARFRMLLMADIRDNSMTITDDLIKAGPVLIEQGDMQGYDEFRRAAVAMFEETQEFTVAERTLKVSILLPVDQSMLNQLRSIEALLENACGGESINLNNAWASLSLALVKYRKGAWEESIKWCERCRELSVDNHPVRIASTHIVQSMAAWKMGAEENARFCFQQGRTPVEDAFEASLSAGTVQGGFWYDWIYARILMREAESVLDPAVRSVN